LQARRAYLRGMFKPFEFCIPIKRLNRMKTKAAVSATVSNPSETTPAMKSQSRSTLTSWDLPQHGSSLSHEPVRDRDQQEGEPN
jgi:hypothetical protein